LNNPKIEKLANTILRETVTIFSQPCTCKSIITNRSQTEQQTVKTECDRKCARKPEYDEDNSDLIDDAIMEEILDEKRKLREIDAKAMNPHENETEGQMITRLASIGFRQPPDILPEGNLKVMPVSEQDSINRLETRLNGENVD